MVSTEQPLESVGIAMTPKNHIEHKRCIMVGEMYPNQTATDSISNLAFFVNNK